MWVLSDISTIFEFFLAELLWKTREIGGVKVGRLRWLFGVGCGRMLDAGCWMLDGNWTKVGERNETERRRISRASLAGLVRLKAH